MATDNFFQSRLDLMIKLQHPLVALAGRLPVKQIDNILHTLLCAAGYHLRWLLRVMGHLGLKAVFLRLVLRTFIKPHHFPFHLAKQNLRLIGTFG